MFDLGFNSFSLSAGCFVFLAEMGLQHTCRYMVVIPEFFLARFEQGRFLRILAYRL
jgi:hypothetical protein